jgi:hypothetical protein
VAAGSTEIDPACPRLGIQRLQQTGMLFIIRQQVQPAFCMAVMQSQQAWIMAQQSLSPLVQVMQTPSSVGSHRHMPIIRLQQQAIIPFIIMQQLHMPPAIIMQRFWSMPAEVASSQVQVIFMPPGHFSMVMVQRGTIIMFMPMPAGDVAGAPIIPAAPAIPMPMLAMPIPGRSVIMRVISMSLQWSRPGRRPLARLSGPTSTHSDGVGSRVQEMLEQFIH